MKTSETRSTIYLDIETFAGEKPRLDSFTADGRLKDPVKVEQDLLKKQDAAWRKQALSSIKGEVFCVGLAVNDGEAFTLYEEKEDALLKKLDEFFSLYSFPTIVAHNGFDFDFLFLFHKGLKYSLLNLISLFDRKESHLVDTMQVMDGTGWKTMISLDNMCKLLLGESAKGDITGKDVHDLVLAGEVVRICGYCKTDVEWLRKCHIILKGYGLTP